MAGSKVQRAFLTIFTGEPDLLKYVDRHAQTPKGKPLGWNDPVRFLGARSAVQIGVVPSQHGANPRPKRILGDPQVLLVADVCAALW